MTPHVLQRAHEPICKQYVRQRIPAVGQNVFIAARAAVRAAVYFSLPCLAISDLWMWGMTPPPAMVACKAREKNACQNGCRCEKKTRAGSNKAPAVSPSAEVLAGTEQLRATRPQADKQASGKRSQATGTHLDEGVQLLITANGQLQVAGSDTLHL